MQLDNIEISDEILADMRVEDITESKVVLKHTWKDITLVISGGIGYMWYEIKVE